MLSPPPPHPPTPSTLQYSNFAVRPAPARTASDLALGMLIWLPDSSKSEVLLVRLDAASRDPRNASVLLPVWTVQLGTNLSVAYSGPPAFETSPEVAVVLFPTSREEGGPVPRLHFLDIYTGDSMWSLELNDGHPPKDKTFLYELLTPFNNCSVACVKRTETLTNPSPGDKSKPTPNPHMICYDLESSRVLWEADWYHHFLHPFDGWQAGEFGSTTVLTERAVLTMSFVYEKDADKGYWVAHSVSIHAFDLFTGERLFTPEPVSGKSNVIKQASLPGNVYLHFQNMTSLSLMRID